MSNVREILCCTAWNIRNLRKNPRVLFGIVLGFLLCFFLTQRTTELAEQFHTDLQILEPFIWCFADADSILFASLALLLPLSQIPRLDTSASYLIFRTKRINWLLAQVLTAVLLSAAYTFILMVSCAVLAMGNAYLQNAWSDTATVLSFSPEQFEVSINVVRKTVKLTTPYHCALIIYFLLCSYTIFLTLLHLIFSIKFQKKSGFTAVVVVSLLAYLLSPERLMEWLNIPQQISYIANCLAVWVSPLQHAAYSMHSFGYGGFPDVFQSLALFAAVNLLLLILSAFFIKNTEFALKGGGLGEPCG